ncbi:DUF6223 family protein [Actinoplanes sp. CA-252034]|uniref:DUF6223 family protein n=1 Tax=Actinoplanes sp. CA-252034 TaxID=3239906 RepID=UPI003D9634D9
MEAADSGDEGEIMIEMVHLAGSADVGAALTADRAVATAAAVVALAGVVAGGWALARARGGMVALVTGAIGTAAGVWVLATADGGPGTGNGVVGGAAGVLFGLVAVVLGVLATARSRRRV